FADLAPLIKKYKTEKFLLPASDQLNFDIPQTLDSLGVNWTNGVFYKTVMSDLSDLKDVYYDILAFFSPTGINLCLKTFLTLNRIIQESLFSVPQPSKKQKNT